MRFNILILFLLVSQLSFGQNHWTPLKDFDASNRSNDQTILVPSAYQAFQLNIQGIQEQLLSAPDEKMKYKGNEGLLVDIPLADGNIHTFEAFYSPVMAKGLADRYPMIRSYKLFSIENPSVSGRINIGTYGFNGVIQSGSDVVYLDPFERGNKETYLIYDVKDYMSEVEVDVPFCGSDTNLPSLHGEELLHTRSVSEEIPLRQYRFALACTGEWGSLRGTVENALSDMVTSVNRLNQIFELEAAMRIILVENNDLLIFFDRDTDPYPNTASGGAMLSVNTGVVNERIGSNTYDLGHVYSTNCDVGGIASLGSMCNFNKAAGVTCHYRNDLDFMAAAVTSHEIGHQMNARHTFNNCNGNESPGNAYEPGSGSTIMSYGGLCGPALNVVNGSDYYYHNASLIEIYNHLRDGGTADGCAEKIETGNIEPEIFIPYENRFVIPELTFFYLEGQATDANDDMLTYCWEQKNTGPQSTLGDPLGNSPHFRSLPPSTSPVRFFPSPDNVLSGSFDRTEVLPTGDREMDFAFTVRDNNPLGGTAVWEEITFNVRKMEEPFIVTSQNVTTFNKMGDELEVTWNVADTDNPNNINCQRVDILFNTSTATSFSWDNMYMLAENEPNDGSATVTLPNVETNRGRIIVRAADNVFFAINSRNVWVEEPDSASLVLDVAPQYQKVCLPDEPVIDINTLGFQLDSGEVTFEVLEGLPAGAVASFEPSVVPVGSSTQLKVNFDAVPVSGDFYVKMRAMVAGVDTFERMVRLEVTSTDHSSMELLTPANGSSGIEATPEFTWTPSVNATDYLIQVSENPSFDEGSILFEGFGPENDFAGTELLKKSTVYYWRVQPYNSCGGGAFSETQAFITEALSCSRYDADDLPINISQSGVPTIESTIFVDGTGEAADVNVPVFQGEHRRNKDLVVSLISPSGTEVVLFSKICVQRDFNCAFDDEGTRDVACPLNNMLTYIPLQSLSAFNGEEINGEWILRVDDTAPGNGGRLEAWALEVCGNVVLDAPVLVANDELNALFNNNYIINNSRLRAEDNNNTNDELVFTLVSIPTGGDLLLNGNVLRAGDQFTQSDIDNELLVFESGNQKIDTKFSFTVIDGEGGWIGITDYNIKVRNPNNNSELPEAEKLSVWPTLTQHSVNVDLSVFDGASTVELIDVQGNLVFKNTYRIPAIVDVSMVNIPAGIYLIRAYDNERIAQEKIVVQR